MVWLPGLVPALNVACRAFGEPDNEVLTCTPVYPPFLSAPGFSDRKRVTVPLALEGSQWGIDWESLERAVTPDTRLFILCHPHNPVGRVWTQDELERLVDFCDEHELVLCSDEIHCDLILDDVPHIPTLSLGEAARRRTITMLSPSKTYNLPGLACAYAVIPDDGLRSRLQARCAWHHHRGQCLRLRRVRRSLPAGRTLAEALLTYLRGNRELVYSFIRDQMPAIKLQPMQATYLAWLDVRELDLDQPVKFFEDAGVGLSNGLDFGAPGFVRLNFGCPRARLQEGLERMARALVG